MGLKELFRRKKKHSDLPAAAAAAAAAITTISSRSSSVNERRRLEEELELVFKKFDSNGDGKISAAELGAIMGSLGSPATEEELRRMVSELDSDGDGHIDLREFIELNTNQVGHDEVLANLWDAFKVFDLDSNGSISADELQEVLRSLGENCTLADCRKMIRGVDADGNGTICFDEFKVMMMRGIRFDV
ncbi:probable calcium-binding protein CML25 [Andrographis paniculata]|uniref:probable calcium-binding protein CML25 n=1 Tax=Andrographis paniculata TaxID=175694 RepID=UPI0021E841F6|nr:probable calcium-binding protein CML25 [Andrographis paniculata]